MKQITNTQILAFAIAHLKQLVDEGLNAAAQFEKMGWCNEAIYYYDNVVKPNEEALETLKMLYEVETGTPYEKED